MSQQFDPPSRLVSKTNKTPSTTNSQSSQSSATPQLAITSAQQRSREDSIALLAGLTENSQLAPAIKAIYDRGWTGTYQAFLDRAIAQNDNDILLTCNEHFEELIYTIDHVLVAKEQALSLKQEVTNLHQALHETSHYLLKHSQELNNYRIIHQNLMITIHILEQINSRVFSLISQSFQQIEEKRYFIALKTLSHVQQELLKYQSFDFAKQIEVQIPILASLIKSIVKQEFEMWLLGLKDRGPILGYFTLHSTHVKLADINRKHRQRLHDRLKSFHMYADPLALMRTAKFATSLARKRNNPNQVATTNAATSPKDSEQASNVYTFIDLNLGCKINIYDPASKHQPFNVLFSTRPSYINKSVIDRVKQMKNVAKDWKKQAMQQASIEYDTANGTFSNTTGRSGKKGGRQGSSSSSRPGSSSIVVQESEEEELVGSEDSDGWAELGLRAVEKNGRKTGGKKIRKKTKRTTTTTTTQKVFKNGQWLEVKTNKHGDDEDEDIDRDGDDDDDDDDDYPSIPELGTKGGTQKTVTSTASGGKRITTTTTTTTSSSSSTGPVTTFTTSSYGSASGGGSTISAASSSAPTSSSQLTLAEKRKLRANAAMASKSNTLNAFRKQGGTHFRLLDHDESAQDEDGLDVSQTMQLFALTASTAANISFIPLHQCLHVYQSLGQLQSFRQLYSGLRHTQATTVKVLVDNSSTYSVGVQTVLYNGTAATAINPVAEIHRPKTKIQAYLPSAAALPTSLSTLDDDLNINGKTTSDARRASAVIVPTTPAVPAGPVQSISSEQAAKQQQQQQQQQNLPSLKPAISGNHGQSNQIISLLQLQQLFSEIMGFFVIEESVIRTGARLLSRTELESLWERGAIRLKLILQEFFMSLPTAQDFLLAKESTMIFLSAMESFKFNVNPLYEFLASQLQVFRDLCLQEYTVQLQAAAKIDRYEPLTIYTYQDYYNLVIATGLIPPSANTNDITGSSTSQQSSAGLFSTSYEGNAANLSAMSGSALAMPNTMIGGFTTASESAQNSTMLASAPSQFPVTMPFSVSIPLIVYITRTFISLLFEYCHGLILPSGSLSANIATYISHLVKEQINDTLLQHRGGNQTAGRKTGGGRSTQASKEEQDMILRTTSVPLAVQGRMNAYYLQLFLQNSLKFINAFVEQRLGDNSTITHLTCFSTIDYTIQLYDRFIVDILKHKVDRISYVEEFPWVTTKFLYAPSDSMLDLTTFLHTTLSCTIFLPPEVRQDVCIHCYEHIAQSILFAFSSTIQAFTQVGLYNFLHDVYEFELLANTYRASNYDTDLQDATHTGGIDKKNASAAVSLSVLTTPQGSGGYQQGTQSAIFTAMQEHNKKKSDPNSQLKREVEIAVMTPTTSKSMLTVSFQRLRQVCLLFVSNDFDAFLDPETRLTRYNLLDGIFLQRLCTRFRQITPLPTPDQLPVGVKYVRKSDVDVFATKLKHLIDIGQL